MKTRKNDQYLLLLTASTLFFSSCATVLNKKTYTLNVRSNAVKAEVIVNDTAYNLPARIKVERSKQDLPLILKTDSSSIRYTVQASPNPTFLYMNLIGMEAAPILYAIDFTNSKRFYYGKSVFLNLYDTTKPIVPTIKKYWQQKYQRPKGALELSLSVPLLNVFSLSPYNEPTKTNIGFGGLGVGLDYYHSNKQFFNLSVTAAADYIAPVPVGVDFSGEYEMMSTFYTSFSNNHRLGRFSLGYGLSYSRNTWDLKVHEDINYITRLPVKKSSSSLGFVFPAYFYISKNIEAGIIYRPSFYRPNELVKFRCEHLVSLDFAYKFRLKK